MIKNGVAELVPPKLFVVLMYENTCRQRSGRLLANIKPPIIIMAMLKMVERCIFKGIVSSAIPFSSFNIRLTQSVLKISKKKTAHK